MDTLQKARDLIGNNRISQCFELLMETFPASTELDNLKSRYTKNEDDHRIGILDRRDYDLEHRRIINALLKFQPQPNSITMTDTPSDSIDNQENQNGPNIFISYANEDRPHLKELKKHLSPALRNRKINNIWYDQELMAGDDWDTTILQNLEQSNVLIILISADFLSAEKGYIWEKEMPKIMEKRAQGNALVIPILLRNCLWTEDPWLPKIQAILYNRNPLLANPTEKDAAFMHAAKEILRAIKAKFPD